MAIAGAGGRASGFEIGQVMAGAVSAGSYTAGVAFLIQALDQWYEGKRGDDPRCPRHDVSLKVMAGTSAAGLSVAIAAARSASRTRPPPTRARRVPQITSSSATGYGASTSRGS